MNMKPARKLTAVAVAAVAVTALAGCTLSYEEAQASEHRVVETSNEFLQGRTWSYVGPDGVEVPLTEDCRDGFFEQRCYGSEDGSVQFRYSRTKHGVFISESITMDGVKYDADCVTPPGWDNDYTCAPA